MITELSKSFAQTFLVGHLLPAILFVALAKFIAGDPEHQDLIAFFESLNKADNLVDLGVFGLILGLLLSTVNRELIRFFEGYHALSPFKLLLRIPCAWLNERCRFRRLAARIQRLSDIFDDPATSLDQKLKLGDLQEQRAREFPEAEGLALPTRFGNTIRAFERYSGVVYKFEAIEGSNRLNAFVDETTREDIAWAKSKVDFWVNASALSLAAAILWIALGRSPTGTAASLVVGAGLLGSYGAITLARHAAYEWGVSIKASIDLALPKLAESLDYNLPIEAEKQQRFWELLSQHFLLRDATTLEDLQEFRNKATGGKPHPKTRPSRPTLRRKP